MNSLTSRWTRMPRGARTLQRAAAVSIASGVAVLAFAGPAMANSTIPLHEAHKGSTAADFPTHECEGQLPETPGKDGWHFVLPASGDPDAEFVSLTLTYTDTVGGTQTVQVPPGGVIDGMHAYVYTLPGWTLEDGTATITSAAGEGPDDFVLSHTCPASSVTPTPSQSGSMAPSEGPSDMPSETPSQGPSGSVAPSEGPSDTPTGSVAPSSSPTPPGGQLPVTGLAIGGIVLTGLGLVGAGAAMRALRRKDPAAADAPEVDGDSDGDADDKSTSV
jgi:hypothetical protein